MNDIATLYPQAQTGRRVTYSYVNDSKQRPGVITGTTTAQNGALLVLVRLDGSRSSMSVHLGYGGLRYLDEVGPVPELPMGRFHPDTTSAGFEFAYDGVLVCQFEDGDAIAVTADRTKAEAAIATFLREVNGVDDETTIGEEAGSLESKWVVFEWEPAEAEFAWLMNPASEGDDMAVPVYYLPW